jgi:protein SCO1/2
VSAAIHRREAVSRRVSAALCLVMLAAFGWGLHRITLGFEVWTFEGRRALQLQSGALRAAAVPLRDVSGRAPTLWHEGGAAPAAYLVDFVYTRCPSVCRVLGSEYQQMQQELATRQATEPATGAAFGNVHLVSVSFDVAHDDPAQLARYAANLGADPAAWTFAVPATPGDARALLRSLGVVAVPDGQGGFVHNGAIHLLDERGRLRGLFEADQWPQALAAAGRLAVPTRTAAP